MLCGCANSTRDLPLKHGLHSNFATRLHHTQTRVDSTLVQILTAVAFKHGIYMVYQTTTCTHM